MIYRYELLNDIEILEKNIEHFENLPKLIENNNNNCDELIGKRENIMIKQNHNYTQAELKKI